VAGVFKTKGMTILDIIKIASDRYDVPVMLIKSKQRRQPLPDARRFIAVEAVKNGFTWKQVGIALGGLHHSTIWYYKQTQHLINNR
jgi:chromosomal replication initiation ATPase DnaA